jgi:tRNA1(Val) A37 N6-methylase TrmN6
MNIKKIKKNYLFYIGDSLNAGSDKLSLLKYLPTQKSLSILEVGPGNGLALAEAIKISKNKANLINIAL